MGDNPKYFIYYDEESGLEAPVIFPAHLSHADVAAKLGVRPTSAGFVSFSFTRKGIDVRAYAESVTLKLESRGEEDSKIIFRCLNVDING